MSRIRMFIIKRLHLKVLSLIILLISCKSTIKSPINLVNKTLEYQYHENIYHLTFDTDSTLHWEAITGHEKGLTGNEIYISEWVDDHKLFITWGEESGTGVSQILDFNAGKVYNHLLFDRDTYAGIGTIKVLSED